MQASSIPAKFPIAWGSGAGGSYIRVIPVPSQIGIIDGAASLTDGFPPLNAQPLSAGGVPPFMQDMNGILNEITLWTQWANAGGPVYYDATFSAAIGGYPSGAVLSNASTVGQYWVSSVDNNTSNPDQDGANWLSFGVLNVSQIINQIIATNTFQQLVANPVLFVRTDGNDANAGTSNSSQGAFATIAAAIAAGVSRYNFATTSLTIQLGIPGTYACPATFPSVPGLVVIQGSPGNQASYILTSAGSSGTGCFNATGAMHLVGVTVQNTGTVSFVVTASGGATLSLFNVTVTQVQTNPNALVLASYGGTITFAAGCQIQGNGQTAISSVAAYVNLDASVSLIGSPTYSQATVAASLGGQVSFFGGNLSGSATGSRYSAVDYGVINTGGQSQNFIPGSSAGGTLNGGLYI